LFITKVRTGLWFFTYQDVAGYLKAHTVIDVDEKIPGLTWYSGASTHDHVLLSELIFNPNTVKRKWAFSYIVSFCKRECQEVCRIPVIRCHDLTWPLDTEPNQVYCTGSGESFFASYPH